MFACLDTWHILSWAGFCITKYAYKIVSYWQTNIMHDLKIMFDKHYCSYPKLNLPSEQIEKTHGICFKTSAKGLSKLITSSGLNKQNSLSLSKWFCSAQIPKTNHTVISAMHSYNLKTRLWKKSLLTESSMSLSRVRDKYARSHSLEPRLRLLWQSEWIMVKSGETVS